VAEPKKKPHNVCSEKREKKITTSREGEKGGDAKKKRTALPETEKKKEEKISILSTTGEKKKREGCAGTMEKRGRDERETSGRSLSPKTAVHPAKKGEKSPRIPTCEKRGERRSIEKSHPQPFRSGKKGKITLSVVGEKRSARLCQEKKGRRKKRKKARKQGLYGHCDLATVYYERKGGTKSLTPGKEERHITLLSGGDNSKKRNTCAHSGGKGRREGYLHQSLLLRERRRRPSYRLQRRILPPS